MWYGLYACRKENNMRHKKEQYQLLINLLNYLKKNNLYWKEKLMEYNEITEANIEHIYNILEVTNKKDILENLYHYMDPDFTKNFSDITSLKEYLLSVSELSNNNDRTMQKNGRQWVIQTTTGTTGKPFPVVMNPMEEFVAAKFLMKKRKEHYKQACISNGFLLAHEVDPAITKMDYRSEKSNMHEVIDYFIEKKPKWMFVSVNSLKRLVSAIMKYRLNDVKKIDVKFIEITGAKLYHEDEKEIRKVFTCPLINQYGCRESWYIAYECPCGKLHINTDNLIIDVVDKKGQVISNEGKTGEVVVTNLNTKTMPFVKYHLGDYAYITQEKCLCGNEGPIIYLDGGRVSERLKNTKYNGSEVFRKVLRVLYFKKNIRYNKVYIVQDGEFHLSIYIDLLSDRYEFEKKFIEVSNIIIDEFKAFSVSFIYDQIIQEKSNFLKEQIYVCKVIEEANK